MKLSSLSRMLSPYLVSQQITFDYINIATSILVFTNTTVCEQHATYIGSTNDILQFFNTTYELPQNITFMCSNSTELEHINLNGFQGNILFTTLDFIELHNFLQNTLFTLRYFQGQISQLILQKKHIPELLAFSNTILKKPLVLCDSSYHLLYYDSSFTKPEPDIFINELLTSGFLSADSINNFNNHRNLYSNLSYYVKKLKHKGEVIGFLISVSDTPHSHLDEELLDRLAHNIIFILQTDSSSLYQSNKEFSKLVRNIIDKQIVSRDEIAHRMKQLRLQIEYYFCIVVCFEKNTEGLPYNYLINQLNKIFPNAHITTYHEQIIILAVQKDKNLFLQYNQSDFLCFLKKHHAYAGFSPRTINFFALSIAYSQSVSAINFGKCFDPEAYIYFFQDYSLYHFVDLCAQNVHNNYHLGMVIHMCHPAITALYRYDKKNNTELVSVLYEFLANNCNALKTAKKLFMHRNTLLNKIAIIKEITQQDLENGMVQNTLFFSCIVLKYILEYKQEDPFSYKLYTKN